MTIDFSRDKLVQNGTFQKVMATNKEPDQEEASK
jgi:hypothetical protein